jgi:hypothetical protein
MRGIFIVWPKTAAFRYHRAGFAAVAARPTILAESEEPQDEQDNDDGADDVDDLIHDALLCVDFQQWISLNPLTQVPRYARWDVLSVRGRTEKTSANHVWR